jgi:hypothetical protein
MVFDSFKCLNKLECAYNAVMRHNPFSKSCLILIESPCIKTKFPFPVNRILPTLMEN